MSIPLIKLLKNLPEKINEEKPKDITNSLILVRQKYQRFQNRKSMQYLQKSQEN